MSYSLLELWVLSLIKNNLTPRFKKHPIVHNLVQYHVILSPSDLENDLFGNGRVFGLTKSE